MGYSTTFEGTTTITPPLNPAETTYLRQFADSRRHQRPEGPYSTREYSYSDLGHPAYNQPPEGQPSLWCNWEPTEDGTGIRWNGAEKFYNATEWMQYLINHFLRPNATAKGKPDFEKFTFDHTVTGLIKAQGDDPADAWELLVVDNEAIGHGIHGY
jgi:hypothetical protein